MEMYPDCQELFVQIPAPDDLCLSKLLNATLSTDSCNTAGATQSKTSEMVYDIACSKGLDEDQLKIYIGHCHHHLQNLW
eukprot:11175817-Ditylum_brightwellii.AAC.1